MIINTLYILFLVGGVTCSFFHDADNKKIRLLVEPSDYSDDYRISTTDDTDHAIHHIKKIEEEIKDDNDKSELMDYNHVEFLSKYPYDTSDYTVQEMMKTDFDNERDIFDMIPNILRSIDSIIESARIHMRASDNKHSDKCNCFGDNFVKNGFDEMEPTMFRLKRNLGDNENNTENESKTKSEKDTVTKQTMENFDHVNSTIRLQSITDVNPTSINGSISYESITEIIHSLLNASSVLKTDMAATPDPKGNKINILKEYLSSVQDSLKINTSDSEFSVTSKNDEHHPHHMTTVAYDIEELKKMRYALQSTLQAVTVKNNGMTIQEIRNITEMSPGNTTELKNGNITEVGGGKFLHPSFFDFLINTGKEERNTIVNETNISQDFSKEGSNSISTVKEYIPLDDDDDEELEDEDISGEFKRTTSMSSVGVAFIVIGITIIVAFVLLTIYAVQKQQQLVGLPPQNQRGSQQNVVVENIPANSIPMEPRTGGE